MDAKATQATRGPSVKTTKAAQNHAPTRDERSNDGAHTVAGATPASFAGIPALAPQEGRSPVSSVTPRIHRRRDDHAIASIETRYAWLSSPGDPQELEADRLAEHMQSALTRHSATVGNDEEEPPRLVRLSGEALPSLPDDVPVSVRDALHTSGDPLDKRIAVNLGREFGIDFSAVRIHHDANAATSAHALQAQAYTFGHHIVFAGDRYAPHTAAGMNLLAHELSHVAQHAGTQRIFRRDDEKKPQYLQISGATFDEAAKNFADLLKDKDAADPARIVVINGPNVRVYDEKGSAVSTLFFHLNVPASIPAGVYRSVGKSAALHPIIIDANGDYGIGPEVKVKNKVDFSKNIDDQAGYNDTQKGAAHIYYIWPVSTAVGAESNVAPPPVENVPDFMHFEAKNKSNLPAWDSAVLPIPPDAQLLTVNSMGTFRCVVQKNQGSNTLDRVTNLMQPTSFNWQVLKLDPKLHVQSTQTATRWEAAKEGYRRRSRDLEADRKTLEGDRKKQSIPETVVRAAIADQVTNARTILAMAGQTVMTFVDALTGGPNQLSTEDTVDIPFKEQGDFFVRCLATQVTPKDAKWRRATSVSGVMVSVYNIEDVAKSSLPTDESAKKDTEHSIAAIQDELAQNDEKQKKGDGDPDSLRIDRAYLNLKLDYAKALEKAGTAPDARKNAELTFIHAQIDYLKSADFPSGAKFAEIKSKSLKQLEQDEKKISAELAVYTGKLKDWNAAIKPVGYMNGVLVDEYTGQRSGLVFAVGEHIRVAADELVVTIADVTSPKGKVFDGSGSGFQGAGRHDAWLNAIDDLRKHLGRGRGYLSYTVPAPYAQWASETPNPMQLQMSVGSQIKEMVDDTAHVMTLAALMAAPFTGGASLSFLAVLAPIQAASSMYNVVSRSMYGDLELDSEAVFDFINIATLGFGKLSEAGAMSSKAVRIVATSSRLAIRLLNGGQFILISYNTYTTLMKDDDPNADPREGRRRRLMALLQFLEAASIPVSEKLWGQAHPAIEKNVPKEIHSGTGTPEHVGTGEEGKAPPKTSVEKRAPGETSGGHATEHAPQLSQAQRRAVPKDLQSRTVVDPSLGRNAKVVYEMGADGLIARVELHVGKEASASDIAAHVQIADLMSKYQGLGGRLRRLRDQFADLFSKPENQRPAPGSRAWESNLELIKLDRMMQDRHSRLALYANSVASENGKPDHSYEAQLRQDLDTLQQQYQEHADVLNQIDLGMERGQGYVAVKGLSEGEKARKEKGYPEAEQGYLWRLRKGELEYVAYGEGKIKKYYDESKKQFVKDERPTVEEHFDEDVGRRKAFHDLGGYENDTSLGKFVQTLLDLGIIKSRADAIAKMQEPGGRTHRTVRHNLKEAYRQQVVDLITSESYLKKTDRYKEVFKESKNKEQAMRAAGMEELSRISDRLEPEDRGSFGESVYQRLFGSAKSWQHVEVSRETLAGVKGVSTDDIGVGRSIDRMDGNTAREIKNVTERLGARERGQIDDMLAMVDQKVMQHGKPRTIKDVAVTFLTPEGGANNAKLAFDILSANPKAPLTFEFQAADGSVVKVTAANKDMLLKPDFPKRLGAPSR